MRRTQPPAGFSKGFGSGFLGGKTVSPNGQHQIGHSLMMKTLMTVAGTLLATVAIAAVVTWAQVKINTGDIERLEKDTAAKYSDIRHLIEVNDERRRVDSADQRKILMELLRKVSNK